MALDAQEIDVLVVGAGPAGLTAAATLRRYGASVLVLERKQRLSSHPRATVVSTRSMELLRSWGLEDEIRAAGMPEVEWLGLVDRDPGRRGPGRGGDPRPADEGAGRRAEPDGPALRATEPHRGRAARLRALARRRGRVRPGGGAGRRCGRRRRGAGAGERAHAGRERPLRDRRRRRPQHRAKRARHRDEWAGPDRGRLGQRRVHGASMGRRRRAALRALPHRPPRCLERVRARRATGTTGSSGSARTSCRISTRPR